MTKTANFFLWQTFLRMLIFEFELSVNHTFTKTCKKHAIPMKIIEIKANKFMQFWYKFGKTNKLYNSLETIL